MRSNLSPLNENEVTIYSTNRIDAPTIASNSSNSYGRRRPKISALLTRADLSELRELIGTLWLVGYSTSAEAEQIVTSANHAGSNFTARMAVRALRLEQALNVAQERIIRLEWNLAQANKFGRSGQ